MTLNTNFPAKIDVVNDKRFPGRVSIVLILFAGAGVAAVGVGDGVGIGDGVINIAINVNSVRKPDGPEPLLL